MESPISTNFESLSLSNDVCLPKYLTHLPKADPLITRERIAFYSDVCEEKYALSLCSCDPSFLKGLLDVHITKALAERRAFEALTIQSLEYRQNIAAFSAQKNEEDNKKAAFDKQAENVKAIIGALTTTPETQIQEAIDTLVDNAAKFRAKSWIQGCISAWTFGGNRETYGWIPVFQEAQDNREATAVSVVNDQVERDKILMSQLTAQKAQAIFAQTLDGETARMQAQSLSSQATTAESRSKTFESAKSSETKKLEVINTPERLPFIVERYVFNYWMSYYLCYKAMELLAQQTRIADLFSAQRTALTASKNSMNCDVILHYAQFLNAFLDSLSSCYQTFVARVNVTNGQARFPDLHDRESTLYWLRGIQIAYSDAENDVDFIFYKHETHDHYMHYGAPIDRRDLTSLRRQLPQEIINMDPRGMWQVIDSDNTPVSDLEITFDVASISRSTVELLSAVFA